MAKIMISVPDDVLKRVEDTSKEMGLNRSAFFTMCASEWINARAVYPKIKDDLNAQFSSLMAEIDKKFVAK